MLVFREIEEAIRKTKVELRNYKDVDAKRYAKATRKLEALTEILTYIKSGGWATTKKSCDRLLYAMKNGTSAAAKYFETTEDSINASLSQYSKSIRKLIGADTLELILNGDVEEGIIQFHCCSGTVTLEKLLLDNPILQIPKYCSDPMKYKIEDCKTELQFLNKYLDSRFRRELEMCDPDKLAYLRCLINNGTVSVYDRAMLVKYLSGHITYDELLAYLEHCHSSNIVERLTGGSHE